MMNYYNPYQFNNNNNSVGLIRVNGINGAKAYQMSSNSTVALFDNNDDLFYVKTTDGAGFPTIRVFRFNEENIVNETNTDYITKNDFDLLKKEVLDYVKQSIQQQTTTTTEQNGSVNANGKQHKTE